MDLGVILGVVAVTIGLFIVLLAIASASKRDDDLELQAEFLIEYNKSH